MIAAVVRNDFGMVGALDERHEVSRFGRVHSEAGERPLIARGNTLRRLGFEGFAVIRRYINLAVGADAQCDNIIGGIQGANGLGRSENGLKASAMVVAAAECLALRAKSEPVRELIANRLFVAKAETFVQLLPPSVDV